jgi:hypothetical protein
MQALAAGKRQDALMAQILARPNIAENWESEEVMAEMRRLLEATRA